VERRRRADSFPPSESSATTPSLLDAAVCLLHVAEGYTHGGGLRSDAARACVLLLGSTTKDSLVGVGHSSLPPSATAMVQASAPTTQVEPSSGDVVVPASPASSEERLDCFLGAIQKKSASPLLAAPARPAVQPAPSEAPRRSSSRLTNNKLARILISCPHDEPTHAPLRHGGERARRCLQGTLDRWLR
jgi:hypothetical protein